MGAGKGRTCRGQKEAQAIKNSCKNKVRARAVSEPAALGAVGGCLCCAGLTKCEYPNVNIQIWLPVGGADLSQAPAVGSSSRPVPGHWPGMELAEEDVPALCWQGRSEQGCGANVAGAGSSL